jgi:hypothetical protein
MNVVYVYLIKKVDQNEIAESSEVSKATISNDAFYLGRKTSRIHACYLSN